MFNVCFLGRTGSGKTHLRSDVMGYPPHIASPATFPPFRVRNKYFDIGVNLIEARFDTRQGDHGDAGVHRAFRDAADAAGVSHTSAETVGALCVVSPRDPPTRFPWHGFDSDLLFRVVIVNCASKDDEAINDDAWYDSCIANGFEYVRVASSAALPRASACTSGLLQEELVGCERLRQLLCNTMWPRGRTSQVKDAAVAIVRSAEHLRTVLTRGRVVHRVDGGVVRVVLSNAYFSNEVSLWCVSPDYVIAADEAFLRQQYDDAQFVFAMLADQPHSQLDIAKLPAFVAAVLTPFVWVSERAVLVAWETGKKANADEWRFIIESHAACPSEVIETTADDCGLQYDADEGKVGLARFIEVLECVPWRRLQSKPRVGDGAVVSAPADGPPAMAQATCNRVLFCGPRDDCLRSIAAVFEAPDGCMSVSRTEFCRDIALDVPLQFYTFPIVTKYYSTDVNIAVCPALAAHALPLATESLRSLFQGFVFLVGDARDQGAWDAIAASLAPLFPDDDSFEFANSDVAALVVVLKGCPSDECVSRFVGLAPIEVIVAEEEPGWIERLRDVVQSTQWRHNVVLSAKAKQRPTPNTPVADDTAEAEPSSVQGSSCEVGSNAVTFGCALPRNIFLDPVTLVSTYCAAVDSKDTALLAEAMKHVKTHGHRLPRDERERQASILSECIGELVDALDQKDA